jgi:hypothetical protein
MTSGTVVLWPNLGTIRLSILGDKRSVCNDGISVAHGNELPPLPFQSSWVQSRYGDHTLFVFFGQLQPLSSRHYIFSTESGKYFPMVLRAKKAPPILHERNAHLYLQQFVAKKR